MGGLELCKRLKGHPATNHIPLIMLAAKEDKDILALEMEVSADEYIEKPFDADLLMARVDNMIRQRQELQRLFQKDYFSLDVSEDIASAQFAVLREIIEKFDEHISDSNYNLESLCEELNISRSQLFRKIKALSNTTPNELLRMIRIKRAAQLLRKNHMNVTQVMLQIGYRTPSHFAASFRKYYGVNPGEYRNQYNNSTNP
jgi:AraC-like DNA-binding protein